MSSLESRAGRCAGEIASVETAAQLNPGSPEDGGLALWVESVELVQRGVGDRHRAFALGRDVALHDAPPCEAFCLRVITAA